MHMFNKDPVPQSCQKGLLLFSDSLEATVKPPPQYMFNYNIFVTFFSPYQGFGSRSNLSEQTGSGPMTFSRSNPNPDPEKIRKPNPDY